jgi:DNA-binding NarL/FixJ family response regulator
MPSIDRGQKTSRARKNAASRWPGANAAGRVGSPSSSPPGRPAGPTPAFPQLTAREREVLDPVAAGRSNAQIAGTLYLSPKTVRNNVSDVLVEPHVADRAEAIIRARDAGLGR